MLFANIEMFTAINKFVLNLFIAVNTMIAFTRPEISLDLAAGELSDEVEGAGAGLADEIDERPVGVELCLARLRGEGCHRHDGGPLLS